MVVPREQLAALTVEKGVCCALFAYDVGLSINLDEAECRITTIKQRARVQHKRRAPRYFEYRPAPLRMTQEIEPLLIGEFRSHPSADLVLYDFGAASVTYCIPLEGRVPRLLALSEAPYENARLLADSRRRVEDLLAVLDGTVERPGISNSVEDYVIFQVSVGPAMQADELRHAHEIARILRSESMRLSEQEVRDATSCRPSYGIDDVTIIDWNASWVSGQEMEDVQAVLEFANVELLEMRYLDQQLDAALDQAYDVLSKQMGDRFRLPGSFEADLHRIAQLQVDSTILFERVTNTLKLLGDQYLARVYRMASQRFHLEAWDASILRKLQTLDSIYGKMADRTSARRLEVLEWIIIVLIALSITVSLLP